MTWPTAFHLDTERFDLEPLAVDHADEMVTVLAPTDLYEFTGGEPPTLEELRARYERLAAGHSPSGDAGWLNWIIRSRATGHALGYVQATLTRESNSDDEALDADLAWLVAPSVQGRGVATECAAEVLAWLKHQQVNRARALVYPHHHASALVAQRIGLAVTEETVEGERVWAASLN